MNAVSEKATEDDGHTFVIGLALAGAVSAGAYTAGVLDTLFRALEAHERKRQRGEVSHRVVVKAMSGASAGSICAALATVALAQGVRPHDPADPDAPGLPLLHELWVSRIKLLDEAAGHLLDVNDLEGESSVRSLLNSTHIDREAQGLLADIRRGAGVERLPYLAEELDLFLTTTNLMGVPYELRFSGAEGRAQGATGHVMASHGAVSHFRLEGLGGWRWKSPWLVRWEDDGTRLPLPGDFETPLDFGVAENGGARSPWGELLKSAVASGAFPIGLASRRIDATAQQVVNRAWPLDGDPRERRPKPMLDDGEALPFIAVDGGVANNEPFELARFAIRAQRISDDWALEDNARPGWLADRAVIMVDPFPEGPKLTRASDAPELRAKESSLLYTAMKLLPSLINQARFKPTELMRATDNSIHSRFLIAPSRKLKSGAKLRGAQAIASGFLGGFGGFFHTPFRAHDYRLGQQNCRSFLEKYFVLDGANQVFADHEGLMQGVPEGSIRILQFDADALPDFGDRDGVFHVPWPSLGLKDFGHGVAAAQRRAGFVADRFMRDLRLTKIVRWLARKSWTGLQVPLIKFDLFPSVRERLSANLETRVLGDLIARNQLAASRFERLPAAEAVLDRALFKGLVLQGDTAASPEEIAAKSEIEVPSADNPRATLTLTAEQVRARIEAGNVPVERDWGTRAFRLDWSRLKG